MGESTSTALEQQPAPQETTGAILFPELVWAHYQWHEALGQGPHARSGNGAAERRASPERVAELERAYRAKLKAFQDAEGEILDVYWCWKDASAVALTAKRRKQVPLGGRELDIRLHRATDWATIDLPAVAELLHHYDALAIKTSEVLTPSPKRIAMEWIFAEQSYLLGFAEAAMSKTNGSEQARQSQLRGVVEKQRRSLKRIEDYYDRAGLSSARLYYFTGMMLGLVLLGVLALAVGLALGRFAGVGFGEMRDYFSTYAAGAIGAVVSVMSRMRFDSFRVDYEVGKPPLWFLGAVRPVLGAIFGTATFFALQSSLVQMEPQSEDTAFYFFAILAFLSGFTERFTHVLFGQAEKTVTATLEAEEEQDARAGADGGQPKTTEAPGARVPSG
jgi:hypothetical protein